MEEIKEPSRTSSLEEVMSRSSGRLPNMNFEGIEPLDFKKDKLPVINYKIQMFNS